MNNTLTAFKITQLTKNLTKRRTIEETKVPYPDPNPSTKNSKARFTQSEYIFIYLIISFITID